MIKQEKIIINDIMLVKTYSDSNKYIIQNETGIEYAEAVDIPNKYTYIESDKDLQLDKIVDIASDFIDNK